MTTPMMLAMALAAIVVAAGLRMLPAAHRRSRPHAAARPLLLIASAALLYLFLQPPAAAPRVLALKLLTAGATAADAVPAADEIVLALPEAPALPDVARVPDLGTALRRHPGATPLRVRGTGLVARDRDAAAGRAIEFAAPPLPAGVVELAAPTRLGRGRRFELRGRVDGAPGGSAELLDPAGQRVDTAALDADGRFRVAGIAGPAGRVQYTLRVRTADQSVLEDLALPVDVVAGAPLRVWVLAGGPDPELKYLRRWAEDAGLALRTRISVGGGVDIGDPPLPFTTATLREFDLAILDERAWLALGERDRGTLREAVREGLGLLLRLGADPGERERALLRGWGFEIETADLTRSLRLPGTGQADIRARGPANADPGAEASDTAPLLSRRPLRLRAADGRALLRAPDGEPLALWRPEGQGRVALWTLSDSFRLVLAGRRAAHGSLWADAATTLSRPRGEAPPALPADARAGERVALCGLGASARVLAPDGGSTILVRSPGNAATTACAGYWPTQAGWHTVVDGDRRDPFPVRDATSAPGLAAAALREATSALASRPATAAAAPQPVPGPRWPWGLAWLAASGLLWWLERPRR